MSWFNTQLYPALESTYVDKQAPSDPATAAAELRNAGHTTVADYVGTLTRQEYEDVLWHSYVQAINTDPENTSDSGYEHYDYEEAYACK